MATYIVLYRFTPDGAKDIRGTIKRAGRIRQLNARIGFKIRDVFWLQGDYDMCAVIDAPSEELMMGAMLNVIGAGNVTSTTMRAFDATEMSRIMAHTVSLNDSQEAEEERPGSKRATPKSKPKR